jgi:hypothetical protein
MLRVVVLCLCVSSVVIGQDKKPRDPEQLRREIADLRSKLAEAERELAKFNPIEELNLDMLEVGQRGTIREKLRIFEILNNSEDLMKVRSAKGQEFYLKYPTKGQADGKLLKLEGVWTVKGPIKHRGQSFYMLAPEIAGQKAKD